MGQENIPNQQSDTEFPLVTVLCETNNPVIQDYPNYTIISYDDTNGWINFIKENYTNNILNCLILPPSYQFINKHVITTLMSKTPIANDNPLIIYGDYEIHHDNYDENIYLPTIRQTNSSIQFLHEIPILLYHNDKIQSETIKTNIYQIFNMILSIHIPTMLFSKI